MDRIFRRRSRRRATFAGSVRFRHRFAVDSAGSAPTGFVHELGFLGAGDDLAPPATVLLLLLPLLRCAADLDFHARMQASLEASLAQYPAVPKSTCLLYTSPSPRD